MSKYKNDLWLPKSVTKTFLSVIMGILTGIVINLLTSSFPSEDILLFIYLISIFLFILTSIASWKILNIRIEIDEKYSLEIDANKEAKGKGIKSYSELWERTLSALSSRKREFECWKRTGIISVIVGVLLLLFVNISGRSDKINNEKRISETSSAIVDSLNHLNRKLDQQKIFILQLKDSIQSIKNEIRIYKDVNGKRKNPRTDNTVCMPIKQQTPNHREE